MATELFFLYDTHCPWSYAATPLLNAINKALPNIPLHLWHNAYYDGESGIAKKEINQVKELSNVTFGQNYIQSLSENKDSTLAANIMAWAEIKTPSLALPLLNALQKAHFIHGNALLNKENLADIISELKLSPSAKIFKHDKLTNDAETLVHEIFALQEIIATKAIPALLLAIDDNLILLNHNFYLHDPEAIVEAVEIEIQQHSKYTQPT